MWNGLGKVCHVTRRFVKERWGGTESSVLRLSQELQEHGIDSPVFSTSMFSDPGIDSIENVPVKRYPYTFPWLFLSPSAKRQMALKGGSPLSLGMLWALLREKNVSLIHTHVSNRLGGIARTVAKWRKIPYVVSVHSGYHTLPTAQALKMMEPFKARWEWGKFFGFLLGSRRTLRDADAIICVGKDEFELMKQRFPEQRVHYVPNGVDVARFSQAQAELFRLRYSYHHGERIILCLSRIDPQKDQALLIKAFAQIVELDPKLRLVLIGPVTDENYGLEISQLANELGLGDRVKIIPGIDPDNKLLPSAYAAAELFVLPSIHEPFGIVILEAWAAGTPVVASAVGGIPGFTVDQHNVLLLKERDEQALAELMKSVLESRSLARQLVDNGRQEVKRYDWSEVARRVLQIYGNVIQVKHGERI